MGLLEVQSLCWLEQLSPVAAGVLCAVQLLVPVKGDEAARCCCYHAPVLDAAVGAGVLDGDGGGGAGAAAAAVPHRLAPEQFDAGFPAALPVAQCLLFAGGPKLLLLWLHCNNMRVHSLHP